MILSVRSATRNPSAARDPEVAIDGVGVPADGSAHQWRSDSAKGLPQWIEVDWGRAVPINTVTLVFTSLAVSPPWIPPARPRRPTTVSSHEQKGRRIPLADEKGNWRRFRRHEFAETAAQGLRLEILRAEGRPEARWYEIRAWRNETPAR